MLTGESDPMVKRPGDDLRSGSLCVAGGGRMLARDVGVHSYAGQLLWFAALTAAYRYRLLDRILQLP